MAGTLKKIIDALNKPIGGNSKDVEDGLKKRDEEITRLREEN